MKATKLVKPPAFEMPEDKSKGAKVKLAKAPVKAPAKAPAKAVKGPKTSEMSDKEAITLAQKLRKDALAKAAKLRKSEKA